MVVNLLRGMKTFSRSKYRVWLRLYVSPKTKAGYSFFKFRLNSKNWKPIEQHVLKMGYKINSIYLEAVNRKTLQVDHSERLK